MCFRRVFGTSLLLFFTEMKVAFPCCSRKGVTRHHLTFNILYYTRLLCKGAGGITISFKELG